MSKFSPRPVTCPRCGQVETRQIAESVNGGRSPHLRAAILAGRFQAFACAACSRTFVIDDPFMYTDFDRKEWIGVLPRAWEPEWPRHEDAPAQAFAASMSDGPPVAREFAEGFRVRAVFGLGALREKLLAFAAELDDLALEALKLDLMRGPHGLELSPAGRPRLLAADDRQLRFVAEVGAELLEFTVPRASLAAVADAAHAAVFAALRGGPYVDLGRIFWPAE